MEPLKTVGPVRLQALAVAAAAEIRQNKVAVAVLLCVLDTRPIDSDVGSMHVLCAFPRASAIRQHTLCKERKTTRHCEVHKMPALKPAAARGPPNVFAEAQADRAPPPAGKRLLGPIHLSVFV